MPPKPSQNQTNPLYGCIVNGSSQSLAAAYGFGLANNHAFTDGNKRTAFLAMFVFLGLNGYRLVATEPEVVKLMLDVSGGELDEIALAEWLRGHSQLILNESG